MKFQSSSPQTRVKNPSVIFALTLASPACRRQGSEVVCDRAKTYGIFVRWA